MRKTIILLLTSFIFAGSFLTGATTSAVANYYGTKKQYMNNRKLSILLAFVVLFAQTAKAQSRADGIQEKLYFSSGITGGKIAKDIACLSLEEDIGIKLNKNIAVFVPLILTDCHYNMSTDKNYDLQMKLGIGGDYTCHLSPEDCLSFTLTGMSTINQSKYRYWQARTMFRYITGKRLKTFYGVGVQVTKSYNNSFDTKVLPVFSIGLCFL